MIGYIVRRLLQGLVTLVLVSLIVFLMVHVIPGGPLSLYVHNPRVTALQLARLRHSMGLNVPIWLQYVSWVTHVIRGQLGYSLFYGQSVSFMIWSHVGPTVELMGTAFVVSALFAVLVGVVGAINEKSLADYAITIASYFGMSLPTFWTGLMLAVVFAADLRWLPASGIGAGDLGSAVDHLILPATTLTVYTVAQESRYIRSSMTEALRAEYVRTALAKGAGRTRVIIRHALRNALIPVITVWAFDLGYLLSGTIVVETIFAWPGLGRLFFNAISDRDYPVMLGMALLVAISIIGVNVLSDIVYMMTDPRIHFD